MTDTAQPATAAETEVASNDLTPEDAIDAFKNFDNPVADRARGPDGKFVSNQPQAEEIDAEGDEPAAESHDDIETDEAADEAQPEAVELPPSWPAELAEEWQTLPAPVQEKILAREAEREAAVNAKFQEAANVRKANEAVITEANQSRQAFIAAADQVMAAIQPQYPPATMLDPRSADYNPDAYHLQMRQAHEASEFLGTVQQQRQYALAQLTQEAEMQAVQTYNEIESKYRPQLAAAVPEINDPAKLPIALNSIVQYAVENGIPKDVFEGPEARFVNSAQLLLAWKAQQFDKMNAAKATVQPRAAKPAAPPVRPGVTTSKSAAAAVQRKNAMERLNRSGSIADAAAVFKQAFKG